MEGKSYGNALANYIKLEIQDLFDRDKEGPLMMFHQMKKPYINLPFECTLKQEDCIGNLLNDNPRKSWKVGITHDSCCLDIAHPICTTNEYKRILMEKGYNLVDKNMAKQNQRQ